jgi:hypothetical protein
MSLLDNPGYLCHGKGMMLIASSVEGFEWYLLLMYAYENERNNI